MAACKGSYKTRKLKMVKSRENWSLWASRAAVAEPGPVGVRAVAMSEQSQKGIAFTCR